MMSKEKNLEWLQRRTEEYRAGRDDIGFLVKEVERDGKLGQGFSLIDRLEEMDISDGTTSRLTYINTNLTKEQKCKVSSLAHEFMDCFAWEYIEMSGLSLSRSLVEHRLPIIQGFRPFKQLARNYNPVLFDRI
jgi:hypothetical protein